MSTVWRLRTFDGRQSQGPLPGRAADSEPEPPAIAAEASQSPSPAERLETAAQLIRRANHLTAEAMAIVHGLSPWPGGVCRECDQPFVFTPFEVAEELAIGVKIDQFSTRCARCREERRRHRRLEYLAEKAAKRSRKVPAVSCDPGVTLEVGAESLCASK